MCLLFVVSMVRASHGFPGVTAGVGSYDEKMSKGEKDWRGLSVCSSEDECEEEAGF